jgi:hypothetical protein
MALTLCRQESGPQHPSDVVPIRVDNDTWVNADTVKLGFNRMAGDTSGGCSYQVMLLIFATKPHINCKGARLAV